MSAGKGSKRRPASVPDAVLAENWERVFGKSSGLRDPSPDDTLESRSTLPLAPNGELSSPKGS